MRYFTTNKIHHTYRFEIFTFFVSLSKTLSIVGGLICMKKSKRFLYLIYCNHWFVLNTTETLNYNYFYLGYNAANDPITV